MLFVFLSLTLSASFCSSIYDYDECSDAPGCYWRKDNRCRPKTIINDGRHLSSNSKKKGSSIKPCFSKYTNAGDVVCFSRDKDVKCGFCKTTGICVPGSEKGADDGDLVCSASEFEFNQKRSNQIDFCTNLTKRNCYNGCKWNSGKKVCELQPIKILEQFKNIMNENKVTENSMDDEQEKKPTEVKSRIFILAGSLLLVGCLACIAFFIWNHSKPLYDRLPLMSSGINLDDLPAVKN